MQEITLKNCTVFYSSQDSVKLRINITSKIEKKTKENTRKNIYRRQHRKEYNFTHLSQISGFFEGTFKIRLYASRGFSQVP